MHRQSALVAVAGLVGLAKAGLYPDMSYDNHTCVLSDPILSCSDEADPDKVDTCCTETFGGLVVCQLRLPRRDKPTDTNASSLLNTGIPTPASRRRTSSSPSILGLSTVSGPIFAMALTRSTVISRANTTLSLTPTPRPAPLKASPSLLIPASPSRNGLRKVASSTC